MPFGFLSLAAISSRRGVSIPLQARANTLPVALCDCFLLSSQWTAVTLLSASVSILYTTASASTTAPLFSARSTWAIPLYMAPIGQIGWQLLLPQQVGDRSTGGYCGPAE